MFGCLGFRPQLDRKSTPDRVQTCLRSTPHRPRKDKSPPERPWIGHRSSPDRPQNDPRSCMDPRSTPDRPRQGPGSARWATDGPQMGPRPSPATQPPTLAAGRPMIREAVNTQLMNALGMVCTGLGKTTVHFLAHQLLRKFTPARIVGRSRRDAEHREAASRGKHIGHGPQIDPKPPLERWRPPTGLPQPMGSA